jgi:colicin import membrane protein
MGTFGVGIWQLVITGIISALSTFGLYHDPKLAQKIFEAEFKALATYGRSEGIQFSYDRVRYSDNDIATIDNLILSIPVDDVCVPDSQISPFDPNLGLPLANPCFADLKFRAVNIHGLGVGEEAASSYKISFENGYLDLTKINSAQAKVLKRLLSLDDQLKVNAEVDGVYFMANDKLDLSIQFDLPQLFTISTSLGLSKFVNDPVYGFSPQRIDYSELTLQDNGGMIPLSEVIMAAETANNVGLPSIINETLKVPNNDTDAYAQLFPNLGPNLNAFKEFFQGAKATKCERKNPIDISFTGPAFTFYQEHPGLMIGLFCEKVTTVPSVTVTRESRENRLQAEKALESWKKSVRDRDQQVTRKLEDTEITRAVERAETLQRSEQRASREKKLERAFKQAEAEAKAIEKRQVETEVEFLDSLVDERAAMNFLDSMTTRITRAWRRPVAFKGGLETHLRLSLASNGELVDVRIVKTSGDVLFDRSALTAVERAAPFDGVKQFDAATFEEKFRSLTVKFRPED